MRISLKELRETITEILDEESWVPGRYYPSAEKISSRDEERLNEPLGENDDTNQKLENR